jgi:hypothetical protein
VQSCFEALRIHEIMELLQPIQAVRNPCLRLLLAPVALGIMDLKHLTTLATELHTSSSTS